MDYYILSNELRILTQRLRKSFEQVFEISLNISLVTGKLQASASDGAVYEVISQKIETIAKKLRDSVEKIILESNTLNKYSLGNKLTGAQVDQFKKSLPLISTKENKNEVEKAIQRLLVNLDESVDQARSHLARIDQEKVKVMALNEQIWLTLSNLRVQLALHDMPDENLQKISMELDQLNSQIANLLQGLELKSKKIGKILQSRFQINEEMHD